MSLVVTAAAAVAAPAAHHLVVSSQPMPSREQRAKEIQRWISDILQRHWDPIGINDDPSAQGEYDAYVGGVYRLIASGASPRELAEHLVRVEAEYLGYQDTDPGMLIPVAERLLRLNVTLDSDELNSRGDS